MFSLPTPDDFHVHVRQGETVQNVLPFTSRTFARALIMPNTDPPVVCAADVVQYREEIQSLAGSDFTPLMTIYLTLASTPQMVRDAHAVGTVAAKFYPRGATTASKHGIAIRELPGLTQVFREMETLGMVLCIHAEDPDATSLAREAAFLPIVQLLASEFPRLKIVVEHVSTAEAVGAVLALPKTVAATVTVHHLACTIDDLMGGLLNPHLHCKPCLKPPEHREALWLAIARNSRKFFLGTDSAPHDVSHKECAAGCAGVFSAPVALPLLVQLFDERGLLDILPDFTSCFGADFYGLPRNHGWVELEPQPWFVPERFGGIVPLWAGRELAWRIAT